MGLEVPRAGYARSMTEAVKIAHEIAFPVMVRPSFILGGGGTGIAADDEEFIQVARHGLATSPVSEILVEESVEGWKEFEPRSCKRPQGQRGGRLLDREPRSDGVHTGDSITVAPIQTLSDREYQEMRRRWDRRATGDRSRDRRLQRPVRGGSGHRAPLVIEMNPR